MITALEILGIALELEGYQGLYVPGECACKIGELIPCDGLTDNCLPGVLTEPPGPEFAFGIGPKKKECPKSLNAGFHSTLWQNKKGACCWCGKEPNRGSGNSSDGGE